ncbi:hypothetical protein L1887_03274 [Cichorium endivia]|nr:hypothetical protein L1887_03274 [Cichorium endivia]
MQEKSKDVAEHDNSPVKNCEAYKTVNQEDIVDLDGIPNHVDVSTSTPETVPNTQYEDAFTFDHNVQNECGGSNVNGSVSSNEYSSPSGTVYWIPNVADQIRSTTKKENVNVIRRYFVCNHQGVPNTSEVDTLDANSRLKKNCNLIRSKCEAGIKCTIIPGSTEFIVYEVEEKHNHPLYTKKNIHLSKTKRKMDVYQKSFIFKTRSQTVGPLISHRLLVDLLEVMLIELGIDTLAIAVFSSVEKTLNHLSNDKFKVEEYLLAVKELEEMFNGDEIENQVHNKNDELDV